MNVLTIILNIIVPPISVALQKKAAKDITINILLTFLGWIPGIIHAFYISSKK